ncbi:MAG: hypothetical protein NVS3B5_21560 [Sphingomicrobium sp.]
MIALLLTLAAAAGSTIAQPSLRPWSTLIGHCWVGQAPGGKGTDKHCFESIYGGQHIRDRHVVTVGGRDVYSGESVYSVKGNQVIFTYWNSLGGLGTGTAVMIGDEWRFTGSIHPTATDAEEPMIAVWRMKSAGYEVIAEGGTPRLFKAEQ